MNIRLTDPTEIEAVAIYGTIKGDVYRDGEVWAEEDSLYLWRLDRQAEAIKLRDSPQDPLATITISAPSVISTLTYST